MTPTAVGRPAPNPTCPACGAANGCAPARSGSFDTPCWCGNATIDRDTIARLPARLRGVSCLCPQCANPRTTPPMHDVVTFRAAVEADALCIGVLGLQVFLDTYATEGIRPSLAREVLEQFDTVAIACLLADAATRCIVAERNGHLIGFAQASMHEAHPAIRSTRPAKLSRLYVQESFVGTGIGSSLLERIEALAASDGADTLWLTTWIGNARALAFYPRRGYRDVGATIYAFEDEEHENRLFGKALPG